MMKSSRFGIFVLLLLLSTPSSRFLVAQRNPARLLPPKTMRLCIQPGCANLVWVGDHYEGRMDGQTALYARYWVRQWTADSVEIYGKTATAMDGVFPAEGTFTGKMSPSGTSVVEGRDNWIIGYRQHGSMPFTATWSKTIPKGESAAAASGGPQVANVAESDDIAFYSPARISAKHPNIMLPPGASEAFADYPDEVRAVLQPEYGLTAKDSVRPCHDPSVNATVSSWLTFCALLLKRLAF